MAPSAEFFATRPNPGMASLVTPVDLAPDDVDGLTSWAEANEPTLTVIGPEASLSLGLADALRKRSLPVFGPSAAAARIESSKAFAKELMVRLGVPTAAHETFTTLARRGVLHLGDRWPVGRKGVRTGCRQGGPSFASQRRRLWRRQRPCSPAMHSDRPAPRSWSRSSWRVRSSLCLRSPTDGMRYLLLPSQDYKQIGEGDIGPNTGGMGAYAPVPIVTSYMMDEVRDTVLLPVLDGLERAANPFRGLLYAGLMITEDGPRVVGVQLSLRGP